MKRLSFPSLLCCLLAFSHCGKEKKDPIPPTSSLSIQFIEAPDSYQVFDTVNYSIIASVPFGVTSVSSSVIVDGAIIETGYSSSLDSALTSISDTLSFIITPDYIGATLLFNFKLEDLSGETLGDTISAMVAELDLDFLYGKKMAGFNNGVGIGSFYDILLDTVYFPNNVRNKLPLIETIDLVFCFDAVKKRCLATPSSNWVEQVWNSQNPSVVWPLAQSENPTLLYDLGTTIDFDAIVSVRQISDLLSTTSVADSIPLIFADRTIGFQLSEQRGGQIGLIRVASVQDNTASLANITLDVKIQK